MIVFILFALFLICFSFLLCALIGAALITYILRDLAEHKD